MEPIIIQKSKMKFVGMSFYGDPFDTRGGWDQENEIGRVWVRFFKYLEMHKGSIQNIIQSDVCYEIHIYNEETRTKGYFEVFVGMQVDVFDSVSVELLGKVIPASQYAVFTLEGEQITTDWHLTVDKWISQAGYECEETFAIQVYDQRFKGVDRIAESELDVYLPLKTNK